MASDPGERSKKAIGKPDTLTRTGIIFALICVVLSMMLDGGNPAVLFKLPALVLVFGGTIAASIAGVVKADAKNVRSTVKKAFKSTIRDPDEDIQRMVGLAEVARREGLLALERAAEGVEDPFFKKGIELTVDGTDPEEIRDIMEGEIESQRERHQAGIKFFTDMGGFSPTLGILGTVIGLVHVLANINSPGTLGPAIASAFTATLWGVLMANLVWLPISNKLRRVSELEINSRRLVLDGILAIQAGSSPRMIEARLLSYLPQKKRASVQRKKAAA